MNTVECIESIYRRYEAFVCAYHPADRPDPDEDTSEGVTRYEKADTAKEI